ncbi:MAG: SDR family NAD(P)-dependent oxidoreductase [Ferruginibacter sp.]|nr:SDR family NAD(P)-dependent oxidoreductase [Ferruginibacter sp.]
MENTTPANTRNRKGLKTIIVTGATGNMGQAMIKRFLEEGYQVIGTVLPTETVPVSLNHKNFEAYPVDVSDESAAAAFINETIEHYGFIDAAVLTVGGFAMGDIKATSAKDIERQFKLNFETAYNISRPVFSHMLERKSGRIFLIGSRPGLSARAGKGMVAYSLAKSLIFRLAELMNDEAKGTNLVTSVVVPSTIDTPQNRSGMPGADFDSWVTPEAIAQAVSFYCSEAAAVLREPIIKVYNNA